MKKVPFEVMCIKPVNVEVKGRKRIASLITVGSKYWVTEEISLLGHTWYRLAGYDPKDVFHSWLFAILPEKTADEMLEEEREAIIK